MSVIEHTELNDYPRQHNTSSRDGREHNLSTEQPALQLPPDGGYGWICCAACFMTNCFTWGVVSSYGVYLAYYLADSSFPTATPVDYAFIGGINFGMAMLMAPLITIMARQWGIHVVMVLGALMQGSGFVAASFASEIWHLYLSQGALVGVGVGFAYVPTVAVLSQWFEKKRSLASGIAAAGSGVGGVLFSFTTQYGSFKFYPACLLMIDKISIAWSLRIIGIVSSGMLILATAMIRHRNEHIRPTQLGLDTSLLHRYQVILLLSWAFVSMLGYIVLLFSLSDFAVSIGLSQQQSANISGFLNLGTAIGRPFIGVLSDRYGRIEVAGLLTFVCSISVFAIWIPADSYGVSILFSSVNGAILGVFWVTIGPLCVEIAGLVELPSLLSLSWLVVVLPTTFSEVISIKLRKAESQRPYLYPQLFAGFTYLVASGIMLELRRKHRKV